MNTYVSDQKTNIRNWILWSIVLLLLVTGIVGNSYYGGESVFYRASAIVALLGVALWIALKTSQGASFLLLFREARVELKKVIWPTRIETGQTTGIVLVVVLFVALILWAIDSIFAWLITILVG